MHASLCRYCRCKWTEIYSYSHFRYRATCVLSSRRKIHWDKSLLSFKTIHNAAQPVTRICRGWVISDKGWDARHLPAGRKLGERGGSQDKHGRSKAGVITIPSSPSRQKLSCRFKACKGGSLDCSFSPLPLLTAQTFTPLLPLSFPFRGANWRQVAPRCRAQVTVTLVVRSAARLYAAGYSSKWWGGGWLQRGRICSRGKWASKTASQKGNKSPIPL